MSNVHRLGDYHNLPESNRAPPQWGPPQSAMERIPFYGMRQEGSGDPKKESFFKMLYLAFCPKLSLFSFTSFVVFACLVLFIIVLSLGGIYMSGSFLQAQPGEMRTFGAMNQQLLGNGEVYRLVTAIFLHWNFLHIFFNSIALLSCMSFMEKSYGILPTIGIFLIGGIGGNIFSACLSPCSAGYAAGASTSIFAVIGAWISFIILNWKGLENVVGKEIRCLMTLMVFMNIAIIWMISSIGGYGNSQALKEQINTDNYGHLGGFLTGILIGLWIPMPLEKSSWTRGCQFTGIALTGTFFLLSFVLFYTTKLPCP